MFWSPRHTTSQALHEQQFRHAALTAIVFSSLVTSVFAVLVAFPLGWSAADRVGLVLLAIKHLVFLLWLRRFPRHTALVGGLHFLILAGAGVWKLVRALLIEQGANGLGIYSYWLPLAYIVAFLAFPGRLAVTASLVLLASLLGVGVAFGFSDSIPLPVKHDQSALLVQVFLAHVTFISFFILFGVLQGRYVTAIAEAESEARAAYLDALTGAPNRRQLMVWLTGHLVRMEAGSEALTIILFDLDHFKRINDTFGHDVGDEVLRRTVAAGTAALRRGTMFGRWGGEEFLVVLPGTALEDGEQVAERLRLAVAEVKYDLPLGVTASFGVAQGQPGEGLNALLRRADEALYASKAAGRNRVQAA